MSSETPSAGLIVGLLAAAAAVAGGAYLMATRPRWDRNPVTGTGQPGRYVVSLDNLNYADDEHLATAVATGSGAKAWAAQNPIAGKQWEADGDDFVFAVLDDSPELVGELRRDGYELYLDQYFPPGKRKARRC